MQATILHNPKCGTSRNVLALIRHAGIEPLVIDYLTNPPAPEELARLISDADLTVRQAIREKGTPFEELGLADTDISDEQLLKVMCEMPILINRPFVVTDLGTRLCRPSEIVLDILPDCFQSTFYKEDGEMLINEEGKRVV